MSKNNLAWSSPNWSDEFKVEFDLIINKQIPGSWKNLLHMTTGENGGASGRIPAIFLINDEIYPCYHVNGNANYYKVFKYNLNQQYHFVISQQYNSDGEAIYGININGEDFDKVINTTPKNFTDVKLYLSDNWHDSFGPYGKLSNLKFADLRSQPKPQSKHSSLFLLPSPKVVLLFQISIALFLTHLCHFLKKK